MEQLPGLPDAAFDKVDPSPDAEFYAFPRFVTHIDDGAIAAVTQVYRERLRPGGTVLDLMSSWVSHLPDDVAYASVVGHGMNADELAANPRLSRWLVQDLNVEPTLPLADGAFDGACLCACCGPAHRSWFRSPTDAFQPRPWLSGSHLRARTSSVWSAPICARPDLATLPIMQQRHHMAIRCGSSSGPRTRPHNKSSKGRPAWTLHPYPPAACPVFACSI